MTIDDTNGKMNHAIIEMYSIRNHLNKTKPGKDFMFERFKEACLILSNKGKRTAKSDKNGFYDATGSVASQYFLSKYDTDFNELFNCTNFFSDHEGSGE